MKTVDGQYQGSVLCIGHGCTEAEAIEAWATQRASERIVQSNAIASIQRLLKVTRKHAYRILEEIQADHNQYAPSGNVGTRGGRDGADADRQFHGAR